MRIWKLRVMALSMFAAAALSAQTQQRFEGIITMHYSPPRAVGRGAVRDGAARDGAARDGAIRDGAAGVDGARGRGRGALDAGRGRGEAAARGNGGGVPPMAAAMSQISMPSEIEYMTRRGKLRIPLGMGQGNGGTAGAFIYVPADGLMYVLIPATSMYTQMSIADIAAQANANQRPMDSVRVSRRDSIARSTVVTHTKKFELIAGHRCEHILVTTGKEKTDICMAKGLGTFIMPSVFGPSQTWQTATDEGNGFPLKVVQTDGTVVLEVTKVERKALPESLFSVPDNYTRMDLPRRPPG